MSIARVRDREPLGRMEWRPLFDTPRRQCLMDSRRPYMATHHVRPRTACPVPFGQLTSSRRGVVSSKTPAQAKRTRSYDAHAFTQASDLAWNSARDAWIGKVLMSYQKVLAHWRGDGKETGL